MPRKYLSVGITMLLLFLSGWHPVRSQSPLGRPLLQETHQTFVVRQGSLEVIWDKSASGSPAKIIIGNQVFDLDDQKSPFFVELWKTFQVSGISDRLAGRPVNINAGKIRWQTDRSEEEVRVFVSGQLRERDNEKGGILDWEVCWRFHENLPGIDISWQVEPAGSWENRVIKELSWQLPLGLDYRKRVAQGGEQGIHWDTRYYYNFVVGPNRLLMPHPEVNIWRHFAIEQETSKSFRIWRAEGNTTAPLIMERGEKAAGWIGAYDQHKGFMAASREMAQRSPASLRVDAEEQGMFRMQMLPPTAPALSPEDPDFERQIAGRHTLQLVPFEGEWDLERLSGILRDWWQKDRLASDPVQQRTAATEDWLETTGNADRPVFPVAGGIPLPRGECWPDMGLRLHQGNRELPVQWHPNAYWPDGSVKWAQLIFPLDSGMLAEPGRGRGRTLEVEITLRDGSHLPLRVEYGYDVKPAMVSYAVKAGNEGSGIRLENRSLSLLLQPGMQWMGELKRNGQNLLHSAEFPSAFVHYLELSGDYLPLETHARGRMLPGRLQIGKVELEEAGPVRSVVRLEGRTAGEEPVVVILRLEMYAGSSWMRIWKTVEFLDADPRERMVSAMGLSLPLNLNPEQSAWQNGVVVSTGPEQVMGSQFQFSPEGYRFIHSDGRKHDETTAAGHRGRGWLTLGDNRHAVTVIQRNFWQEAPRENRAERWPVPALTAYFWPDAAPVMDVRRYSDFPHRSQGESVPDDNNYWVYIRDENRQRSYYDTDPFKGISKTFETLWGFHEPDLPAEETDRIAADFHSRPLIYAGEEHYRRTGVTLPWGDSEKFPWLVRNYDNMINFWLFNQRFWKWYSPWQYGDTAYGFHSGQGSILPPEALARLLAMPGENRYNVSISDPVRDYYPNNEWTFDNGRWGWSMTEKLQGQFWQMQYLRTGRRDVFFQAEAYAANARDVVVRHHGRWFGRGTRHGVQQWSCGNHEERQTVHLEWRYHYMLTGDRRSADVNDRLTHEYYLNTRVSGAANPSGRLPGLLMHWERTGDRRTHEALKSYVRAMIDPGGIRLPAVDMRTGELLEAGTLNSPVMFFHTFGGMHALLEYWYLLDDDELKSDLKQALLRMAEDFTDTQTLYAGGKVIGFAARHSDEPRKYLDALDRYLNEQNRWRNIFQTVSANPQFWGGPSSFLEGAATGSWSRINKVPYWSSVWEDLNVRKEPTEQQQVEMAFREENGVLREIPRLEWQSDYDHPDFDPYFDRWRPWSAAFVHPVDKAAMVRADSVRMFEDLMGQAEDVEQFEKARTWLNRYYRSRVNYLPEAVPQFELPDVLTARDGTPVRSADQWETQRRPEIKKLFEEHVYGKVPVFDYDLSFELLSADDRAWNGKATRKQVRIRLADKRPDLYIDVLIYLPNASSKPVPAVLGLNFFGNHTIAPDPEIFISEKWMRPNEDIGIRNNRATEKTRGVYAERWQVGKLLEQGYAVVTAYCGDMEPDAYHSMAEGVRSLVYRKKERPAANEWGTIGAWAWGLSRIMDYLETDPDIDSQKVALIGHSRLGKTALWAGAVDDRFAAVISNNSGCGGAALSRRRFGETLGVINTSFPHWFADNFRAYNDREAELPVDQHMLIALIAPRPVYVASAQEDRWADPKGEFLSAREASPVYKLYGLKGLLASKMPDINQPVFGAVGYHIRSGGHAITAYDWEQYLNFLNMSFRRSH